MGLVVVARHGANEVTKTVVHEIGPSHLLPKPARHQ